MSCVAELKAISQKKTSVHCTKWGTLIVKATPAIDAPRMSCITIIHQRFDFNKSTTGLQKGLITHGRYSQEV